MDSVKHRNTLKVLISKNVDYNQISLSGVFQPVVSSLKKISLFDIIFSNEREYYHSISFEIAVLSGKICFYINSPIKYVDMFLDQFFVSFPYVESETVKDTLKRDYRFDNKLTVYTLTFKKKITDKQSNKNSTKKNTNQNNMKFESMFYGIMQNCARSNKDIIIQYIFSNKHFQIKILPLNFIEQNVITSIENIFKQVFVDYDFNIKKSKQTFNQCINRQMTSYKNKINNIDEFVQFIPLPNQNSTELDFEWALYTKKSFNFGDKAQFDLLIGTSTYREKPMKFGVNHMDRFKHMYVIGKSGTGKSTLLTKFIKQDLHNNYGISILDPHGELVEDIEKIMTKDQKKRAIYFDGINNQLGLNLFLLAKPENIHFLTSGYISIFLAIFGHSWGPRLEHILRQCLLTLLTYSYKREPQDLEGIIRLLTDAEYRKKIYNELDDRRLKDFWVNEFNNLDQRQKTEAVGPILNKVGQFLSYEFMYKMLTDKKSTFNALDIMNNSKIFLGNLAKGVLGEDAMRLIGMLLIVQYQINSFTRKKASNVTDVKNLAPHFFYIDEFQNFITENFCSMLSECRKYKLGFILANQYVDQLTPEVRSAIFGNVGNLISFTVSNNDAELLAKEFGSGLTANDFVSLPRYTIYAKIYWEASSIIISGKS